MILLRLCLLTLVLIFIVGCTGSGQGSSPVLYGEHKEHAKEAPQKEANQKDDTEAVVSETSSQADNKAAPIEKDTKDTKVEAKTALDSHKKSAQNSDESNNDEFNWQTNTQDKIYYDLTEDDDSASAVDDDLWRQLDLADEYHSMGVIANRDAAWEEAQYYFEKGLSVLANLDVETDSSMTPEAAKYSDILNNIISEYRRTLRSLGKLNKNVSSAVLIERFGDLGSRLGSDTLQIYNGESAKEITYDLPIVMNERVKSSIVYFQTAAKEAFKKYLRRSKRYTPMMKRILREYGLPDDLIYLSLIESGYNPHAYSWARAMGLWQFISSTGKAYGLKRSWWIDERKDPIKSTHSAARFLKDLYKEFGDWELAMAAYNGGPGRVRRTIKKMKTDDFWKLKLKRQTMDYVPLIMAATIIAKDPEKYGFHDIEHEAEIVWDEVTVTRCLELKTVARELGCGVKEIQTLNPELLRRYTPPNAKKYTLKIPKGKTDKFWATYDNMPSPQETSWVKHKIKRGETVSTIAAKYGVSQYAVFEANNLSRRSRIYAGKTIIVPVPLDREYQDYKGKKNRKYNSSNSIYVVRSGDTMWDIARAFGTTVSALRQSNYINRGSRIYVGQKLKIPSDAKKLKNKNSKNGTAYANVIPPSNSNNSNNNVATVKKYKVRSGDTLWDIAKKYGTTTSSLRKLNNLGRNSRIYPGQQLNVSANGNIIIHKVKRGETLSSIASRYRTSVSKIRAFNRIDNPNRLSIGEKLKINLK